MVVQSVEKACESASFDTSSLQALVVVTQNGDGAETIPHVSAIAHGKLGLGTDVLAFDVGLGCSGYVYGLVILSGLMKQMGRRAALVTADPYSRIINPEDRSTSLYLAMLRRRQFWIPLENGRLGTPFCKPMDPNRNILKRWQNVPK